MAFDPDSYLQGSEGFDPDAYLRGSIFEKKKPFLTSQTPMSIMKGLSPVPTAPFENGTTFEKSFGAFQELPLSPPPLQTLESVGREVKRGAIGDILEKPFTSEFIQKHGAYGSVPYQIGSMALDLATPFSPSQFGNVMAGALPLPEMSYPLAFRNPEKAIGRFAENVTGTKIPQKFGGESIRGSFERGVGGGINKIEKQIMNPLDILKPKIQESVQGIEAERIPAFQESLSKTYGRFYPEEAPPSKVGQANIKFVKDRLKSLKSVENEAWKNVSSEHPASIQSDTKEYIENTIASKTTLSETKPGLPSEMGVYTIPTSQIEPNLPMEQEFAYGKMIPRNVSSERKPFQHLQNILVDLDKKDLNFNDLKQIRTKVSSMIDWNAPRGDEVQYHLKNVYGTLTQDMQRTAREGGFTNRVSDALKSTRDVYGFLEQPSTKAIFRLQQEPSRIIDVLIGKNSPERVNYVMSQYDKETQGLVRRGFVERLAEKSRGDPDKFSNLLSGYSNETKKALFGSDASFVDSLQNYTKKLYKSEELQNYNKYLQELKGKDVLKLEDVVGERAVNLTNLIRTTDASELIGKISKGSVEDVQMLNKVLDEKGQDILQRGFLSRILDNNRIKTPMKTPNYDVGGIARDLHSYSDDWLDAMFQKNSDKVKALRDISRNVSVQRFGNLFYEIDRTIQFKSLGFIDRIIKRFRLPGQMEKMSQKTARVSMFPRSSIGGGRIPFIPLATPFSQTRQDETQ